MRRLISSSEKKAAFVLKLIMRHFIFSEEITRCFIFFTAELTLAGVLRLQAQVPRYFLRKNEGAHYFLKKMRCLIICYTTIRK